MTIVQEAVVLGNRQGLNITALHPSPRHVYLEVIPTAFIGAYSPVTAYFCSHSVLLVAITVFSMILHFNKSIMHHDSLFNILNLDLWKSSLV